SAPATVTAPASEPAVGVRLGRERLESSRPDRSLAQRRSPRSDPPGWPAQSALQGGLHGHRHVRLLV
ncbi:MAG: hypothetical protein ACKOJF_14160, partial [Planctomycetaceae bacterium]